MIAQRFGYSLLILLFVSSCQKVIELDLPPQDPKPVIEALLYENSPAIVFLSETLDIFNEDEITPIENAQIYLTDDRNQRDTIAMVGQGFYRGDRIVGTSGRTYILEVIIEGKRYEARSTLMPYVHLDSIKLEKDTFPFFPPSQITGEYYEVSVDFTDPPAPNNYYLIDVFYNPQSSSDGFPRSRKIPFSDRSSNGQALSVSIFNIYAESGDDIQAYLYPVDPPVFEYFQSLDDASLGSSFTSAAPANPKTNFSGGALGYFQASPISVQVRSIP